MEIFWPYVTPMLVICGIATIVGFFRLPPMARTALVIAGNWVVNTGYVWATGLYDPWFWFILTDTVSAQLVLYQPAGKTQSLIGWTYISQIIMHGIYAISNPVLAAWPYWQMLTALAFVQLALLGGWVVGHGGGAWYRAFGSRYFGVAGPKSRKGVV